MKPLSGILTFVVAAASAIVGLSTAAGPASAADPAPGQPCSAADLGKRYPVVKSARVEPTITHFKTFFVTEGTTGSQTLTLETSTTITVEVGTTTQIQAGFNILTLGRVEAFVNRTVKKITASTDKEVQTITWNFNAPGYYGLFKGTRKVSGEYAGINCDRVDLGGGAFATQWVERPGGTYTTYSVMEEGAIRCADVVPPNSLMRLAQIQLGCDGVAARERAEERAKAGRRAGEPAAGKPGVIAPLAVPPGFTCDSALYRIGTPDRLLAFYDASNSGEIRHAGWTSNSRAYWRVCQGPQSNGKTEYVFVGQHGGNCLAVMGAEETGDGGRLEEANCAAVDDRQRFYVYQDVAGSNLVGLQVKRTGFMIGQARLASGEQIRQYSTGMADGTGTFLLDKVT